MSLGVRSRGFSCHKMASTTATAVKRLRPTQASFCCKRFELQLAAVKCPQKYNFLICPLRKWITTTTKASLCGKRCRRRHVSLLTKGSMYFNRRIAKNFLQGFVLPQMLGLFISYVSINVIISDCFFSESPHHGTNTAWVPQRLGATTRWPWVKKRRESTRDYNEELRETQR